MKYALVGNQNCGKTTLFNALTGSKAHTGNFPGVTIEQKSGPMRGTKNYVTDLPGIYSLSPYSKEEVVTREFLLKEHPEAIINIVDATALARNLYLTLQLIELHIPMVIALNMIDELRQNDTVIDINKLSEELGCPVYPISALKNEGIEELIEGVNAVAKSKALSKKYDFCQGAMHEAIHTTVHLIEPEAKAAGYPLRFAATKLLENDSIVINDLNLPEDHKDIINHIVEKMERETDTDREAAIVDMRYNHIDEIIKSCLIKHGTNKSQIRSKNIDKILTNKYLAIPIFFVIMLGVFAFVFGPVGSFLSGCIESFVNFLKNTVDIWMTNMQISDWLHSLVVDGVFGGVGSVLSFLPIIVLLFFCLGILEDSGYMARVAFFMDSFLRKIGLSGRCFVPMLIGFGCSVPAVMATRTLSSSKDRKMTALLIPFMSCSAKMPVYALLTQAFFPRHKVLVMMSLYILGILSGIIYALILQKFIFKSASAPFVLELPSYRFPSLRNILTQMWEKTKDFLQKAFTVIFLASLIIWFLSNFDVHFNYTSDNQVSLLALLGKFIAPVFMPLGFGDWRTVTSLITGLAAKEAVVSTLSVLLGVGAAELAGAVTLVLSSVGAYTFLVFILLYMPCIATFAAMKREFNSFWQSALAMLSQTIYAYGIALLIHTALTSLGSFNLAEIFVIFLIIILIIGAIIKIKTSKSPCVCCASCSSCEGCKHSKDRI